MAGEGDEIVRTRLKNRDNVNPLVPGSSPGGPTNFLPVTFFEVLLDYKLLFLLDINLKRYEVV